MLPRWYNSQDIKDAESVDIQNLMLPVEPIMEMDWDGWGETDGERDAAKAYVEDSASIAKNGLRPATVYFDLGSAKVSEREKAHLEFFANSVVDNATKLLLTGSADKQTGTAKGNQKLSEQRVDAVKALLEKLGANGSNIDTVAKGDTDNKFDTPAKNRCVVIEVK